MQIVRVETYPLLYRLPRPYGDANGYKKYRSCFLIKLITDSGLSGWGECIDWLPTLQKGFDERITPFLLGKSALDRHKLVKTIKKWHQRAAAAVSMALTEIAAQQAKLSIADLWGGRFFDEVPVYASFQSYTDQQEWISHSAKLVEQAVNQGFSQVKVKIGGRRVKEDQQHITWLLKLLPEETAIAIDANQSYDVPLMRQWQQILSKEPRFCWVEEPMPLDRTEEYKLLRSMLSVPIAGGENLLLACKFLPLLRQGSLDIIQPDPNHEDGLDGYRHTLELARDFGLRASPHTFDGALSRYYALVAQACLPPFTKMNEEDLEPVEWDVMENPFACLLPVLPQQGKVKLPKGIGLGVEIDHSILTRYKWDGGTYV